VVFGGGFQNGVHLGLQTVRNLRRWPMGEFRLTHDNRSCR
jgi:hypothetical protein